MNYQPAFAISLCAFILGLLVYALRRTYTEIRSRLYTAAATACGKEFGLQRDSLRAVAYANAHLSLRLTRCMQYHDANTWLLSDMTLHVPNASLRLLYVRSLFDKLLSGHALMVYIHLLPARDCQALIDDGWERDGVMLKKCRVCYTVLACGEEGGRADCESAPAPKTIRSEQHAEH